MLIVKKYVFIFHRAKRNMATTCKYCQGTGTVKCKCSGGFIKSAKNISVGAGIDGSLLKIGAGANANFGYSINKIKCPICDGLQWKVCGACPKITPISDGSDSGNNASNLNNNTNNNNIINNNNYNNVINNNDINNNNNNDINNNDTKNNNNANNNNINNANNLKNSNNINHNNNNNIKNNKYYQEDGFINMVKKGKDLQEYLVRELPNLLPADLHFLRSSISDLLEACKTFNLPAIQHINNIILTYPYFGAPYYDVMATISNLLENTLHENCLNTVLHNSFKIAFTENSVGRIVDIITNIDTVFNIGCVVLQKFTLSKLLFYMKQKDITLTKISFERGKPSELVFNLKLVKNYIQKDKRMYNFPNGFQFIYHKKVHSIKSKNGGNIHNPSYVIQPQFCCQKTITQKKLTRIVEGFQDDFIYNGTSYSTIGLKNLMSNKIPKVETIDEVKLRLKIDDNYFHPGYKFFYHNEVHFIEQKDLANSCYDIFPHKCCHPTITEDKLIRIAAEMHLK